MSLLEIKDLKLSLDGNGILNGMNLSIPEGHVYAVVGPNGAGKSSLSYTIMGLDGYRNIEGDIIFDGESIKNMDIDERARKGITLAWQDPARFEGLSVVKYIECGAADKSLENIKNALDHVGLSFDKYSARAVDTTLSGGERKKVELAAILAMKPRLVILDEPDSGIDVESLRRIKDAMSYLKSIGSTVLLITHSMEVLSWAENSYLMCCGKVVDEGSTDKIQAYFGNKCIPCDHENIPEMNGDA